MTSAPQAPDAKSPPTKTPRADSKSVAQTTDKTTSDLLHDGDGGFAVGQPVHVRDDVRPRQYAGRQGTVAEVRRVVPKSVVDALHRRGKTTNNGDFEIGVDFSSETVVDNLRPNAWFLPRELALRKAVHSRSGALSEHARTSVEESTP